MRRSWNLTRLRTMVPPSNEPELFPVEPVKDLLQVQHTCRVRPTVILTPGLDRRFYVGTCPYCNKPVVKKREA